MSPPVWLIQLLAVITKEIKQTVQDRRMVFLLLVAPLLQLTFFGFAINQQVDNVPTIVVDQDDTPESRAVIAALFADGTLHQVGEEHDVDAANRALEEGSAAVAILMPKNFARDRARGDTTGPQLLLDGADPTRAAVAGGAAGRYILGLAMSEVTAKVDAMSQGRITLPGVDIRPRLLFNPTLASAVYFVPGIAGMLLLIVTTMVTAMGLAREAELGTLEQVRVTPIPTPVLLLGKTTPFVAIGMFDVAASITVGSFLFDVPLRGELWLFFFTTSLYLLTTVGLGLFVATVSSTQQQAFISAYLIILPALLLSGTLTPIHAMPHWLQPLTFLNPLRFYSASVRAILLKGADTTDLLPNLIALAVYGSTILGLAAFRFRKRLG
jgi:ABC-2 type transport system permease protein